MAQRGVDWLAGGTRQELARRAIYLAAREELRERGPEKFTAEAVARRAGCSRATLYRLAGGKGALLDAVMAGEAAVIAQTVGDAVADLSGVDRVVEAIVVALREVRADPTISAWVRAAAAHSDFLPSSAGLAALARNLSGGASMSEREGAWIVRVVLQLLVWPVGDEQAERSMVRDFVGPAFAA